MNDKKAFAPPPPPYFTSCFATFQQHYSRFPLTFHCKFGNSLQSSKVISEFASQFVNKGYSQGAGRTRHWKGNKKLPITHYYGYSEFSSNC